MALGESGRAALLEDLAADYVAFLIEVVVDTALARCFRQEYGGMADTLRHWWIMVQHGPAPVVSTSIV